MWSERQNDDRGVKMGETAKPIDDGVRTGGSDDEREVTNRLRAWAGILPTGSGSLQLTMPD